MKRLRIVCSNVQTGMAFIEHDFGNGLTVKNSSIVADYTKFYQNVYPGNGPLSGAVNPSDTTFNRAAARRPANSPRQSIVSEPFGIVRRAA
jgi:catecholate siderophore receptor